MDWSTGCVMDVGQEMQMVRYRESFALTKYATAQTDCLLFLFTSSMALQINGIFDTHNWSLCCKYVLLIKSPATTLSTSSWMDGVEDPRWLVSSASKVRRSEELFTAWPSLDRGQQPRKDGNGFALHLRCFAASLPVLFKQQHQCRAAFSFKMVINVEIPFYRQTPRGGGEGEEDKRTRLCLFTPQLI